MQQGRLPSRFLLPVVLPAALCDGAVTALALPTAGEAQRGQGTCSEAAGPGSGPTSSEARGHASVRRPPVCWAVRQGPEAAPSGTQQLPCPSLS